MTARARIGISYQPAMMNNTCDSHSSTHGSFRLLFSFFLLAAEPSLELLTQCFRAATGAETTAAGAAYASSRGR